MSLPDNNAAIDEIRHDLRNLVSLLFALRAGLERIDDLDPDMKALCDGATARLQSIIDNCQPSAKNGYLLRSTGILPESATPSGA